MKTIRKNITSYKILITICLVVGFLFPISCSKSDNDKIAENEKKKVKTLPLLIGADSSELNELKQLFSVDTSSINKEKVEASLEKFKSIIDSNDVVLIHVATHGYFVGNDSLGNWTKKSNIPWLENGYLAFFIDDTMKVNTPSKVVLTVSKNIEEPQLLFGIASLIQEEVDSIKNKTVQGEVALSSEMTARLSEVGNKNFLSIQSQSSETQYVELSEKSSTTWEWVVIPTKTGVHKIKLVLNALIKNRGKELTKTIPVFEREIEVLSNKAKDYIFYISIPALLLLIWVFRKFLLGKSITKESEATDKLDSAMRRIKGGYLTQAISELERSKFISEHNELNNQLIQQKARLSNLKRNQNLGIIEQSDYNLQYSKISFALIELIKEVKENAH